MGSCISSHQHHNPSAMKLRVSSESNRKPDNNNNNNHLLILPSPVKEKPPVVINGNVAVKPQFPPLRDFGSKEEMFYDSQAWLDSDCDDDFMSVNGEFTPSRGNTPMHHTFVAAATPPMKVEDENTTITPSHTSPSPTKKKKRLSELFAESLREPCDVDDADTQPDNEDVVVGSSEVEAVHGGGLKPKPKRERLVEVVHVNHCLPSLLSSCRPVTPQQTEARRKRD